MRKKILVHVLVFSMLAVIAPMVVSADFSDVLPSNTHYTAITGLSEKGILGGYPDGTFKPDSRVTRAEFATIICRVTGLDAESASTDTPFDDANGHWAAGYINLAYGNGIIKGTSVSPPLFDPEGLVTFEQAVTMIVRALGFEDEATGRGGYPEGYLYVGAGLGLNVNTSSLPGDAATRGTLAQIVYNAYATETPEEPKQPEEDNDVGTPGSDNAIRWQDQDEIY